MVVCFFFFKQKTAYEMRISDWSSDVCSSDLRRGRSDAQVQIGRSDRPRGGRVDLTGEPCVPPVGADMFGELTAYDALPHRDRLCAGDECSGDLAGQVGYRPGAGGQDDRLHPLARKSVV